MYMLLINYNETTSNELSLAKKIRSKGQELAEWSSFEEIRNQASE